MNFRFNTKHLVLCLSLSVFFSCKKDDSPAPTPPEPTLFEKVQGRWNAEIEAPPRTSNVSPKEQDRPHVATIEFFSDSSYILAFTYGVVTGKLSITDSAAFNLSGEDVSAITKVQLSNDSISFTCQFGDNYSIDVKAGKVSDLSISADKKPLLKRWVLSKEQDGDELYEQEQVEGDEKISMFFSAAGSAVIMYGSNPNEAVFMNWKWHPQVANAALLYSIYGEQMSPGYFKIVSLTNSSLTIESVSSQEGQPTRTYVLNAE